MAKLVPCKTCGHSVANNAKTCPSCGIAYPGVTAKDKAKALGLILFIGFSGWLAMTSIDNTENKPKECAKEDLQCLGDKLTFTASGYCQRQIEAIATHSVRWTDGMLEPKFSRFRWKDKNAGSITLIGDRAEFQNGFGTYTAVIYQCDIAQDGKTVLDVRVNPGRL